MSKPPSSGWDGGALQSLATSDVSIVVGGILRNANDLVAALPKTLASRTHLATRLTMQSRESELLAVVADEAVRLALDGGASVEVVAGAAAERLDDAAEGIAVSLRFPVPEPGRAAHGIAANR